ncbi:unnamed protein product [Leptidea sinapis]|uniref:Uncharacterized protein n=1 Tax=Leptidea sinapis TaxID=189913 RepID=A0A5E4PLQ6_9NEOP|nr:unnamed protein product [Leptidea sinapis]
MGPAAPTKKKLFFFQISGKLVSVDSPFF